VTNVTQPDSPSFSQAAIDALRRTPGFEKWNHDFEDLRRAIRRRVSPRDIRPLLKAGADEDKLVTLLAFVVCGASGLSPEFMARRKSLAKLAEQLMRLTQHAAQILNDPLCDGRAWLALEAGLSWDLVPKAGVIESSTLEQMRALARLVKDRGDAFGRDSRSLKKTVRTKAMRDLIVYVHISTNEHFDAEIAYLLEAAHRAVAPKMHKRLSKTPKQETYFTADQIKKFRQRQFAVAKGTIEAISVDRKLRPTKSFGQRIAEVG
jgi:hypothetical protein